MDSIAPKVGCVPQTLLTWVKRQEIDSGKREGVTTVEAQRVKELEREVKQLRRANEILKLASAFFAQAELDRRIKSCGNSSANTAPYLGSIRSAKCCRLLHQVTGATQHESGTPDCNPHGFSVTRYLHRRSSESGKST